MDEMNELDPRLERFLDADTIAEKIDVLMAAERDMTDYLVDSMATSMDLVIPDGPVDERTRELIRALRLRQKYEIRR